MPQNNKNKSSLGLQNQMGRMLWSLVWTVFARPIPRKLGNTWNIWLLRGFGAKIHRSATIYSSAKIYMPWKLEMKANSCLAEHVNCYNVTWIIIGENVTISQKSYLCAASHDINDSAHPLLTAPIIIEKNAWVATDAFIGMGVTIGEGAVVGARAAVFKDVPAWMVVGGNPATILKRREFRND